MKFRRQVVWAGFSIRKNCIFLAELQCTVLIFPTQEWYADEPNDVFCWFIFLMKMCFRRPSRLKPNGWLCRICQVLLDRILWRFLSINSFTFLAAAVRPEVFRNGAGNFCLEPKVSIDKFYYSSFLGRFDTQLAGNIAWESMPPLPAYLFNYFAIEMGGQFYVAGQYNTNIDPRDSVSIVIFCFNFLRGKWMELTVFNGPSIMSMTKSERKINFTFKNSSAHSYDPNDNSWVEVWDK